MRRLLLAAGVVLGAAAVTGFSVPPRLPDRLPVPGPPPVPGDVPLDPDLPPVLRAHLDPDGTGRVRRVETFAFWARGRLRVGPAAELYLDFRAAQRVGHGFVHDITITWYGQPLIRGGDVFAGGRGRVQIGPFRSAGPEVDQGANLAMWGEALVAPSVFAAGSPVRAVQEGADTVRLTLPSAAAVAARTRGRGGADLEAGGTDTETAWLTFVDGRPRRFRALRHRAAGRPKEWWCGESLEWHQEDGLWQPGRLRATWEADEHPWLDLEVGRYLLDVPVDARLA